MAFASIYSTMGYGDIVQKSVIYLATSDDTLPETRFYLNSGVLISLQMNRRWRMLLVHSDDQKTPCWAHGVIALRGSSLARSDSSLQRVLLVPHTTSIIDFSIV